MFYYSLTNQIPMLLKVPLCETFNNIGVPKHKCC